MSDIQGIGEGAVGLDRHGDSLRGRIVAQLLKRRSDILQNGFARRLLIRHFVSQDAHMIAVSDLQILGRANQRLCASTARSSSSLRMLDRPLMPRCFASL